MGLTATNMLPFTEVDMPRTSYGGVVFAADEVACLSPVQGAQDDRVRDVARPPIEAPRWSRALGNC